MLKRDSQTAVVAHTGLITYPLGRWEDPYGGWTSEPSLKHEPKTKERRKWGWKHNEQRQNGQKQWVKSIDNLHWVFSGRVWWWNCNVAQLSGTTLGMWKLSLEEQGVYLLQILENTPLSSLNSCIHQQSNICGNHLSSEDKGANLSPLWLFEAGLIV